MRETEFVNSDCYQLATNPTNTTTTHHNCKYIFQLFIDHLVFHVTILILLNIFSVK